MQNDDLGDALPGEGHDMTSKDELRDEELRDALLVVATAVDNLISEQRALRRIVAAAAILLYERSTSAYEPSLVEEQAARLLEGEVLGG